MPESASPGAGHPRTGKLEAAFVRGKALICYAAIGDPLFDQDVIEIYSDHGVDVLEVGLPSERPYADGPTVRSSMLRSLRAGMDAEAVIAKAADLNLSHPDLAKIWMCYDNTPLEIEKVPREAYPDGLLMVGFDPLGQHLRLGRFLNEMNIRSVGFVGYDAPAEQLELARFSSGYIMLQAKPGLTGTNSEPIGAGLAKRVARLRSAGIDIPIAAGIGISTAGDVRSALDQGCDGIIIGSAALQAAAQGPCTLSQFLSEIREAMDLRQV